MPTAILGEVFLSILIVIKITYTNKKTGKQLLFCVAEHKKLNVELNNYEYNYEVIQTFKIHLAQYWITDISVLEQNMPSFPQYIYELSQN
jgi:hypothetical protein